MTEAALLDVDALRVTIGTRTLVERVDFSLRAGESLAIVGESGSGKSLTARAIIGLLPRGLVRSGSIKLDGRELVDLPERELRRVRGDEIALVLQDPFTVLNPLMRCGLQITEGLKLGFGPAARRRRRSEAVRRLAEVGIDDPGVADLYPFQLSGGMRQRVAISAALARDPRILIADEPSTALDVTTQKAILELIKRLQETRGMALVLVTHDLRVAFSVCDDVTVLYAGSQLESGPSSDVQTEPLHPYTLGLMLSEPPLDAQVDRLVGIPGTVPAADTVRERCAFADRCEWAIDVCREERPAPRAVGNGRRSACRRVDDLRSELRRRRVPPAISARNGTPSATDVVLAGRGLVRDFRVGSEVIHAVRGVDVHVCRGESIGIVGESGSGKTTVGRCLVGLDAPTGGEVLVGGVAVTDRRALPAADRLRLRHTVQIVFQDPYSSLNPKLTVGQALHEALQIARNDQSVEDLLAQVGLPARYATRKPVALSGGERQRVAIARALAVRPDVLICDEAVSALDVSVQAQVLNLLNELRERLGLALVFISHDLAVVRQVAERVYVMHRGEVVEEGSVGEVLDQARHAYTRRLIASVPRYGERPNVGSAQG